MNTLSGLLDLIFDPSAVQLQEYDRAFNPLRVLGVERYEIRHVNTLAWLLDPSESHGLGDSFFRLFMRAVCDEPERVTTLARIAASRDGALHVRREVTTEELRNLATSEADAALRGELESEQPAAEAVPRSGFLDLLVQGEGWLLGLEAKIASSVHSRQLERYRLAIEKGAPREERLLVYLNCDESDAPDDPEWVHVTWQKAVIGPLRKLLEAPSRSGSNAPELHFLRGYLEVLEAQCRMPDSKREALLSDLVQKHDALLGRIIGRAASNLSEQERELVRLNSRLIDELSRRYQSPGSKRYPALQDMIRTFQGLPLTLSASSHSTIRFLPSSWLRDHPWIQEPGRPYPRVICELFNRSDLGVQFKLMVCDLGDKFVNDVHYAKRRALLDRIQQDPGNNRGNFPNAFRGRDALPREPYDQYFGVMLTKWFSGDDIDSVRRNMEQHFLPSVRALTALM